MDPNEKLELNRLRAHANYILSLVDSQLNCERVDSEDCDDIMRTAEEMAMIASRLEADAV